MTRRSLYAQDDESVNIFQSFTDLMSNAFMIISFFLLLVLLQALELNQRLQAASPIIIDEQSGKFKFKSGSAELTTELTSYIQTAIAPKIEEIAKEREIDFIQVIGHTDGQEINKTSNLDSTLEEIAQGRQAFNKLKPGSNVDLGLMRALAVVKELEKTSRLKNIKFRAYSAAQLYLSSGQLAPRDRNPDENRRRIEIRFIPPGEQK
jgi:flagellar motor protein MotB